MKIANYILLVALILSGNLVQSQEEKVSKFSWDDIPESKADIGAFPYITAPNRLIVDKNESQSYEFDKLEIFNGSSFFVLDGKVERRTIEMDGGKKWEKYWFEKSVSEYLKSIGTILFLMGKYLMSLFKNGEKLQTPKMNIDTNFMREMLLTNQ